MCGEPLQLVGPGVFGGDGGFLFLTVAPTRRLLEEQAVLESACEDAWPDYRPGVWLPHVTLAAGLTEQQLAEGVTICRAGRCRSWRASARSRLPIPTPGSSAACNNGV